MWKAESRSKCENTILEPAEAKETVNTWVHPAPGEGACFRCLWTDCVDTFADDFTLTQHLSGSHGLQAIIKGENMRKFGKLLGRTVKN